MSKGSTTWRSRFHFPKAAPARMSQSPSRSARRRSGPLDGVELLVVVLVQVRVIARLRRYELDRTALLIDRRVLAVRSWVNKSVLEPHMPDIPGIARQAQAKHRDGRVGRALPFFERFDDLAGHQASLVEYDQLVLAPLTGRASSTVSQYRNRITDLLGKVSVWVERFHWAPRAAPKSNLASSARRLSDSSSKVRRNAPMRMPGYRTAARNASAVRALDLPLPSAPPRSTAWAVLAWNWRCFAVGT